MSSLLVSVSRAERAERAVAPDRPPGFAFGVDPRPEAHQTEPQLGTGEQSVASQHRGKWRSCHRAPVERAEETGDPQAPRSQRRFGATAELCGHWRARHHEGGNTRIDAARLGAVTALVVVFCV